MTMTDDCLVVGDIHGGWFTLVRLLNKAPKGLKVVFHGDLIDRGPNSRKVVEFAMDKAIPTCLGNHCDLCLAFYGRKARCASFYERGIWLSNGGDKAVKNWPTIDSRGKTEVVRHRDRGIGGCVPDDVLTWMESLPPYLTPSDQLDDKGRELLVSHTGYGLCANREDRDGWMTALWGRYPFDGPFASDPATGEPRDDGFHRVFGHTPCKQVITNQMWHNIDTGSVYGDRGGGKLSALLWPSKTIIDQVFDETPCEQTFQIVEGRLT